MQKINWLCHIQEGIGKVKANIRAKASSGQVRDPNKSDRKQSVMGEDEVISRYVLLPGSVNANPWGMPF